MEKSTGEWYSATGSVPEPIRLAGVEASHKRLGNVILISALAREVGALLTGDSGLLSNVLSEGGHSGNSIDAGKIEMMRQEIALLRERASKVPPEVILLLNDLEELAAAAEENHNPIVFV